MFPQPDGSLCGLPESTDKRHRIMLCQINEESINK